MEGCIHANGWGAMEATAERRVFDIRWYQKGALPVIDHQWCRSLVRAKDLESWPSWTCPKQFSASSEEAWRKLDGHRAETWSCLHKTITLYGVEDT
jgi:hypothetical protein